jgi:hypothetical protein
VEEWKERLRQYQRHLAVGVVVLAWAVAFRWGFAGSDWEGAWWGSAPTTRGDAVVIKEKEVLTEAERQGRLAKQKKELGDTFREIKDVARSGKKQLVGDRRQTRGDDLRKEEELDPETATWTQREMCQNMKVQFPDRFRDVDCMSNEYDDTMPWYQVPQKGSQ